MSKISCKGVSKQFRTQIKSSGIGASLKSLWKRDFKEVDAVKSFDLEVGSGEIIGLLGPNGAGKTTLMKLLTGIMPPSAGSIRIGEWEPYKRSLDFRRSISLVMGQKTQLWWDIPAIDTFNLIRRYFEIDKKEFKQWLDYLTELLNVRHLLETHVRKLSLGERMKLELIACLLHKPKITFLDEPTIGLDFIAQQNIRAFIKDYHREHRNTIVLTSHYMKDIEVLCPRIVLVNRGEKTYDGPIANILKVSHKTKQISVTFRRVLKEPNTINFQDLVSHAGEYHWEEETKKLTITLQNNLNENEASINSDNLIYKKLADFGIIETIKTHEPNIEEIISNHYYA